ncbi:MAG: PAS domain S-box protein [Deltaproteobacteria bacterium]|nr:PAS domain S-box protein [Deltaproteobacteria bacterium]
MAFPLGSTSLSSHGLPHEPRPVSNTFSAAEWIFRLLGEPAQAGDNRSPAEGLGRLPASRVAEWRSRLGAAAWAELEALGREPDAGLFFESLLAFGRRCESEDRPDAALAVYGLLREGTGISNIEARATQRLQAIQGVGATGPRAEFLLRRLAVEASDPALILSMGLAGAAYRVSRLGLLGRLAVSPAANTFTRGFGAQATAGLGAFLVEASAFTLTAHGLNDALGRTQDWSPRGLGHSWAAGALTLGSLKFFGWAGGRLYQRALGAEGLAAAASPGLGRTLFQQGSMFAGILSAHRLEEALGLRGRRDGATTLVDGLATLLQFNVAGRLSHHAFGEGWRAWERGLDLHAEAIARRLPERPAGSGGPALAWATASGPRLSAGAPEIRDPLQGPFLVFMEGLGDKGGPEQGTTGTGGEPLRGREPTTRDEIAKETEPATEEPISWLPKGPQQLEVALREFLNMHPHSAVVFELSAPESGGHPGGTVLMINRRLTEMIGYSEAEALGRSLQTFMHMRDMPFFRNLSESLLQNGTLDLPEVRYRRKDGSSVWCSTTGMVKRVSGRSLGFAFLEDITERRRERAALEASEVRNRALIGALPDLLFRIRADMTFLDVRLPQAGQFVLPVEQLIGTRVHDLPLPEDLKQFGIETMRRALETGAFQRVEYELPMPDGSTRHQEARVSPSGADEVVVIVRDTTDLKRAEQHRIAAERLDAVQMLSRGLAHNIANRLAVVLPYQQYNRQAMEELRDLFHRLAEKPANGVDPLLSEPFLTELAEMRDFAVRGTGRPAVASLQSPGEVFRALEQILNRALQDHLVSQENAELILSAIQSFRRLSTEPQAGPPFDLNTLLDPATIRGMLGEGPHLVVHRAAGPTMVPGPREHIADALQNLIVNARDAMQGLPTQLLRVETSVEDLNAEQLQAMQVLSPGPVPKIGGPFLRLSVTDTGTGVDALSRNRIFEAYYSTKSTAQVGAGNRGLGLALTYKHVTDAGGFITLESQVGEGSTFSILLPIVPTPRFEPVPEDPRAALQRRLEGYFRENGHPAR